MSKVYIHLSVLVILAAGCRTPRQDPADLRVDGLFRFAGRNWTSFRSGSTLRLKPCGRNLEQAEALLRKAYYREAEDCLSHLWLSPCAAEADFLTGVCLVYRGEVPQGVKRLRNAVEQAPKIILYRVALVWALCRRKAFKDAEVEALAAAEMGHEEEYWAVLHEVREFKRASEPKSTSIRRISGCLIVAVCLITACLMLRVLLRLLRGPKAREISKC